MTDVTFVLIPGAGGSAWYWHLVAAELRSRSHDVVAVDLPADDPRAGLFEYASVVVEAVGHVQQLILVAQSLAGFTAPLVCEHREVQLLVLVNAMIPMPGETPGEWWTNTGHESANRAAKRRLLGICAATVNGGRGRWTGVAKGSPSAR